MAYCRRCGAPIYDDTYICPRCGVQQGAGDSGSALWALLGLLIPVAGLILFIVWHEDKPRTARMAGLGALASVALYVLVYAIILMTGIALVSSGS